MHVLGLEGPGGCWEGNVVEGPPGISGLEMTWSEGRAPVFQNQSFHLQGERRKDKDASHHRWAYTHTHHGESMHALNLSYTHWLECNILCVSFKYGFKGGLCRG